MKRQRRTDLFLLLSTLLLALTGQYYFSQLRDRFWDGVFFYAVAVGCLIGLLVRRDAAVEERPADSLWRRAWRAVQGNPARSGGILLSLLAVYTAIRLSEAGQHGSAVVFWLLSIAFNLASWWGLRRQALDPVPPPDGPPPPGLEGEAGRKELLLLIACTLLALILRLVHLGIIPYVISGDEASMGIEAIHVLQGELTNPFATGWLSHPTLYFFLIAGPIGLLGRNAWGLRLLSPLVGSATIPVLYLLARRLFGRRVALAAMLLLTASHLHIHFSRLAINNIYDPLLSLLVFLFLVRGMQEGRILDFALSGLFLGLSQYFYMGGRLIPVILVAYVFLWRWFRPATPMPSQTSARDHLWLPLTALVSSALVTFGPLLRFFTRHPNDFMARIRMVGIIQSGWLETEPQITGKTALQLLWEQFRKSFLAFNYTLDPTSWYNAPVPYLDWISAVFFVLGLVFLLRHWRRRGYLLVNAWFWPALLIGGVLIENPPSSPRFVIFTPAVCLIAALGLVHCLDLLTDLGRLSLPQGRQLLILVLLVVLVLNIHFYFFRYTPAGIFGGLNTEVGTRVGEYLQEQPPGYRVYFFGPPRMWVGYATIPFLVPDLEAVDLEEPLMAPPTFVDPARDALLIFLPERAGELEWVVQAYPEGIRREFYGHSGELLFIAYEIRR